MSDYISPAQARARLSVSRTLFDKKFRPQLTEYRFGDRAVRYALVELEQLAADAVAPQEQEAEGPMIFSRRTVEDALNHAWRTIWQHSKGARKKAQLMKVCVAEVGKKKLVEFDYNAAEEWVDELRIKDLAIATIKTRLSCVYFALGHACKKGWIKAVPPLPTVGTPGRKLRYLDDAELALIFASIDSMRYQDADVMRDVVRVLVDTGARLGELIKVREDSLHLRGSVTRISFLDRKAGDDLHVPMTTAARDAMYRLLASKAWKARVRGARESAKRLNSAQNWITHRFTLVRNHAKLLDVSAHTLRHTFASRLVQRGVSIYEVQKLLGHADIRMTERYSHLAPSSLDAAIQKLEPEKKPEPTAVANLDDYRK